MGFLNFFKKKKLQSQFLGLKNQLLKHLSHKSQPNFLKNPFHPISQNLLVTLDPNP